ncbi:MAG: hypothetical protein OXG72_03580 [Acidobacteria bacterium]|nr:hypothetical protein [Acidobacteriota bacterium]
MPSFEYLADGHHVDEAGNLISCTYVDFRDPEDRFPITALHKASSKRHAIPGCETLRISKPHRFLGQGEGLAGNGQDERDPATAGGPGDPDDPSAAREERPVPAAKEVHCGRNGWIYCASIDPEMPEQQAARRKVMPPGHNAISPIRRPRKFARALGAMATEQAGPRGRIVLLRNTVNSRTFCMAHKSQTVYHGPVLYLEDQYQRMECASSDLELILLLVFTKHAAHRSQREYRFLCGQKTTRRRRQ